MEERQSLLHEIRELAGSRANDAVHLAFLDPKDPKDLRRLRRLDLSAVTEFKRNSSGTVELKFIDRLAALQWLLEQSGEDPNAGQFYQALEQAADTVPAAPPEPPETQT